MMVTNLHHILISYNAGTQDESFSFPKKIRDESLWMQTERSPRTCGFFPPCLSALPKLHPLALTTEMSGGGGLGSGCSYQKFVHLALEQTRHRSTLVPHPSQVLARPNYLLSYTFFSCLTAWATSYGLPFLPLKGSSSSGFMEILIQLLFQLVTCHRIYE